MEYSNLTDKGDANYNESTQVLTWSPVNIEPGGMVQKTFTVTVKNPLPATPTSASNPLSYDYIMHNVYGRDVFIKLNKPASKQVEQKVTVLPNTGPGTTMIVSALATMVVAFFLYRSRLMYKEMGIVKKDYVAGGL